MLERYCKISTSDYPSVFLEENNRETELLINGQFKDLKAVENLLLHTGKTDRIPLNSTADVHYDFRKPEDISRLDGREMVTLYVHAAGDANIVQVAGDLRDEIARLKAEGYSINTVFDLGSRMEKSIGNVLISVFTGMASIAVFLFLALPSPGIILHLTLSLALIDIFTISLLSALSIPIDQAILAGMAVGTGMMIDGGLVITEAIQRRGYSFRTTAPPLIASTTTTLIVFIPLIRSASSSPAIVSLSLAIIFLLVFSLFYYLTFLPRFLSVPEKNSITEHRIMKPPRKLIVWCTHHPWAVLGTSSAIFTASLGCSFILPRDIDQNHEPGTLFAQLEMESGAALSSVDERNSAVVQVLTRQGTGILSVESRARVGQGQLTIRYDPEITSPMDITLRLEEAAAGVPGVFAYIPDGAAMEGTQVKFSLSGPDNGFLRKLAMEIADNSLTLPWVSSCVLHFKEDPPSYVFVPDTEILQQRLLNTRDIANFLQWGIQGPVALKWIQNGQERDLRVFLSRQNIENLSNLHDLTLNTGSGERVKLDQLGKWQLSKEPSTITHVNRQRAVDFSLITNKSNLTEVLALAEDFIMETPLPSGYGLFHDRSLEEKLGEYRSLGFSLILSLMLIFAVLSIQSESLRDPLIELSILPISLSLPIIIYTLTGQTLRSSTLIGLILLSGMSVNNSILILSCFRTSPDSGINAIVRAVCQRYRSLILTTGTTLLGTLPLLLFPGDGNYFTKDMALILALGLVGSFSASLTCYPALLTLFESKCKFIPQDGLLIRTK